MLQLQQKSKPPINVKERERDRKKGRTGFANLQTKQQLQHVPNMRAVKKPLVFKCFDWFVFPL